MLTSGLCSISERIQCVKPTNKREFLLLLLQSEIFDKLLEEAEQMHIKRKEATEMLKVFFEKTLCYGEIKKKMP